MGHWECQQESLGFYRYTIANLVLPTCQAFSWCFTYINSYHIHNNLCDRYCYYLCFTDKETESQKWLTNFKRKQSSFSVYALNRYAILPLPSSMHQDWSQAWHYREIFHWRLLSALHYIGPTTISHLNIGRLNVSTGEKRGKYDF